MKLFPINFTVVHVDQVLLGEAFGSLMKFDTDIDDAGD
jgi:hypothetical protein